MLNILFKETLPGRRGGYRPAHAGFAYRVLKFEAVAVQCEVSDSQIRVVARCQGDADEDLRAGRKKADLLQRALDRKIKIVAEDGNT